WAERGATARATKVARCAESSGSSREREAPCDPALSRSGLRSHAPGAARWRTRHDPQAQGRTVSTLFAEEESQDRAPAQSRHLRIARRRGETRARGTVLQARRLRSLIAAATSCA